MISHFGKNPESGGRPPNESKSKHIMIMRSEEQ